MESPTAVPRRRRRKQAHARKPSEQFFSVLNMIQGALILSLIVAAPWMFGTTQDWSIRLMNIGSFIVGFVALVLHFQPNAAPTTGRTALERWLVRAFFGINLLLLAYCLIAVLNARAAFSVEERAFAYREGVIRWLPTTYDSNKSLPFLINTLAFFSIFWSTRLWASAGGSSDREDSRGIMNNRLKIILWVLVVNGFLVGLQGILQRLSG